MFSYKTRTDPDVPWLLLRKNCQPLAISTKSLSGFASSEVE
jgi:hypothetical protein